MYQVLATVVTLHSRKSGSDLEVFATMLLEKTLQ